MASLEELFERYRHRGDLAALGAVFDRTAPALLRIALHLCGNRTDAEDVVQATYLRAIEAAESFDASRPLVPWLVGILGNRARHRRASSGRRPDTERLTEPPSPDDPLAHAAQRELGDAVAATIGVLPEHYRSVLRLHLLDGRDPAEIATVLARSPGTVRSQLARGLAALRRLLPPGFAAGIARAWILTSLPRLREAVLVGAGAPPAVAAASGLGAFGGLAMKKVTLATAALLAAVGLCLLLDPDSPPPTPSGLHDPVATPLAASAADAAQPADAAPLAPPGGAAAGAGERIELAPRADTTAAATGGLRVRVRWKADGSAADAVPIFVRPYREGTRVFAEWQLPTAADGTAVFAHLPPGRVEVTTGRSEYADHQLADITANTIAERTFELAGVTVSGIVVDATGEAIGDARIVVAATTTRELLRSAPNGRFTLRGIGPETKVGARATGHAPAPPQRIPAVQDGRIGELRLVLPGLGGRLVCTVVDASGVPIHEALVTVSPGTTPAPPDGAATEWLSQPDGNGQAVFDGVAVGDATVVAWAADMSPWRGVTTIAADATTELRIELQPGAVLQGQARDLTGRPLAGCEVAVGRTKSAAFRHFGRFAFQYTRTDATGRYRLVGLPPGEVNAHASLGAASASATLRAQIGATLQWDPDLVVGADINGRVLGPDGRGIAANVEGRSRDRSGVHLHAFADDEGRFTLRDVAPGEQVRLDVRIDYFPVLRFDGALPHDGEFVLRLAQDALPSVRIAGIVVDDVDRPLPMAEVGVLRRDHGSSPVFTTGDDGRFDVGVFPPGDYRLFVDATGRARTLTDWMTIAPATTADAGRIRLDPGCTVEVHLQTTSPLREPIYLPVRRQTGDWNAHVEIRGGKGELSGLAAGRYQLLVLSTGLMLATHEFQVTVGDRTRLDLPVEVGVPTTITLLANGQALPKQVTTRLTTTGGRLLLDLPSAVTTKGRILTKGFALLPGSYRVQLHDAADGRAIGDRAFTVLAGAADCAVEVPLGGG